MAAEIELELTEKALRIAADGPPVQTTAVVRNRGTVVDQYSFQVEGIDPTWWEVTPPSVSLFPGDEATVTLRLQVPAGSVAGDHPFQLRAVSGDDPARAASAEVSLQVAPTGGLSLSLEPSTASGRRGRHTVTVKSGQNQETAVTLEGVDAEAVLAYRFEPAVLAVPPFGESLSDLEVGPTSRRWWGRAQQHTFAVRAVPEGGGDAVAEAEGSLLYRPLVGSPALPAARWQWLLVLIPLLALALLVRSMVETREVEEASRVAARATAAALATQAAIASSAAPSGPQISRLAVQGAGEELPRGMQVSWDVQGGEKVAGQLRDVGKGPADDASRKGEYRLEASGEGGAAIESVQVVTLGPPIIRRYVARPPVVVEGSLVRLEWDVVGADAVDIEGEPVNSASGTLEKVLRRLDQGSAEALFVRPGGGIVLRAKNAVGVVSSIAYAEVVPASTPRPTAVPTRPPTPPETETPTATATEEPTATPTPAPTETPAPALPADVPEPPTSTPVPPTETPVPPTETPVPVIDIPLPEPPTETPVPPTDTPTPEPPTPTETPVPPTYTPTSLPQCLVNSFTLSPDSAVAPVNQGVVLTWNTSSAGSIAIRWTDDGGPHEYKSTQSADQTAPAIARSAAGTVTFTLFLYGDSGWTEPACADPVEAALTVQAPPTYTPTLTPTPPPPPCAINQFTVSPATAVAPFMKQQVTLSWSASGGVASVLIQWNDDNGARSFSSPSATGSTAQYIDKRVAGPVVFTITGYRPGGAGAPGPQCAGPVTATLNVSQPPTPTPTPVPVAIQRFTGTARCVSGSAPDVTLTWAATGGADARVELYRNVSGRPVLIVPAGKLKLSDSYVDKPTAQTTVNYTLVVSSSAGKVSQTQPEKPFLAVCIY